MFGIGLLLLVFGVSFAALSVYGVDRRLPAALFTTFVSSLFLAVLGGVTLGVSIVLLLLFVISYYFIKE
jgi:hypothetical protein